MIRNKSWIVARVFGLDLEYRMCNTTLNLSLFNNHIIFANKTILKKQLKLTRCF